MAVETTASRPAEGIMQTLTLDPRPVDRLRSVCGSILEGRQRPEVQVATSSVLLPGEPLLAEVETGPLADLLPGREDPIGYPGAVEGPDPWFRELGTFGDARPERGSLTAVELGPDAALLELGIALVPTGGGSLPVCLRLFMTFAGAAPVRAGRYLYAFDYAEPGYEGHDHQARPATDADVAWFADAVAAFQLVATASGNR